MMQFFLHHLQNFAAGCGNNSFFGLPTWYQYLKTGMNGTTGRCEIDFNMPGDIPLILLAIVDILLRVAGLVAVAFVIYGGVQYVVSQGEADKTAKAKGTIINALVGMVLAILAATIVGFIGNRLAP